MNSRSRILLAVSLLCGAVGWSIGGESAPIELYRLQQEPRWRLGWSAAVPGGTLISGDAAGAWALDLTNNLLLRLDETLSVRATAPLPSRLRNTGGPPRLLHVAGFGRKGAWILEPATKQIWRFLNGAWSDPITSPVSFSAAAALSERQLLVNAPEADKPLVLMNESGKVTARFGQREPPPFDHFAAEYGGWVVASGRKTWTSAHRFLPVVEQATLDGKRTWRSEPDTVAIRRLEQDRKQLISTAVVDPSGCCVDLKLIHFAEAVQTLADGSVLMNYSAAPAFVRLGPSGQPAGEARLAGPAGADEPVGSIDRFGFAAVGSSLLVPVHDELRVFARAGGASGPSGMVVDPSSDPIDGAAVSVRGPKGKLSKAACGADGWFVLADLGRDELVSLTAVAPGFLERQMHGVLQDLLAQPIVLDRVPTVCVTVSDAATGNPVTKYRLSLDRNVVGSTGGSYTLSTDEGPSRDVEDAAGKACVEAPWKGPFLLAVTSSGYARTERRVVLAADVEIQIEPEARVHLVLTDADQVPVIGAEAMLVAPAAMDRPVWKESFQVVTDTEGKATITGVPSGEWEVAVRLNRSDGIEERRQVKFEPGENTLEIALASTLEARVTVLGPTASPVPGASVRMLPTASVRVPPRTCETGADGSCTLSRLQPGRYVAGTVSADGVGVEHDVDLAASPRLQEVTLRIGEGSDVEGRLLRTEEYAGAAFSIRFESSERILPQVAVEESGKFVLKGCTPGRDARLIVSAQPAGAETPWAVMDLAVVIPSSGDVLTIEVPPPLHVHGTVRNGARPCAGCEMRWETIGLGEPRGGFSRTSPDGSYSALLPSPGHYTLSIQDDVRETHSRSATISTGRAVDFQIADGALVGTVVDKDTREPSAGCAVSLIGGDGLVATRTAGDDGDFRFENVSAGAYRVLATTEELTADRPVSIRTDATSEVTLELDSRGGIVLFLRDGTTGAPLHRYLAHVYDRNGAVVAATFGSLPPDGRLRLPAGGEGPFTAVVSGGGFAPATLVDLSAGESPRVVSLTRPCRLILEAGSKERGAFAMFAAAGSPISLSADLPPTSIPFIGPSAVLDAIPTGTFMARYVSADGAQPRQWTITTNPSAPVRLQVARP